MKKPAISNTSIGLSAVFIGLFIAIVTWFLSPKRDDFRQHGLERKGRVLSLTESPAPTLRLLTNTSANSTKMEIVEVEVPENALEKAPVGSNVSLLILPGDPPRASLDTPINKAPTRTRLVIASFFTCVGIFFLWLDLPKKKRSKPKHPNPQKETPKPKTPPAPKPLPVMEKLTIKDTTLYKGTFEFSYADEKTRIELTDGSTIRINQYRPLSQLSQTITNRDLVEVLRTAKSQWKIPRAADGRKILAQLVKDRAITGADQFFINGDHLGLLFRDEVDNGLWHSWVRGVWKISPLSKLFEELVSRDAARSRTAANEVLYHNDIPFITALAPDTILIREAAEHTPRDRRLADNRRSITLAADMIEALKEGKCQCQVYAATTDFSPAHLVKEEKFVKVIPDEVGYIQMVNIHHVACSQCDRQYQVTGKIGGHIPNFVWEKSTKTKQS